MTDLRRAITELTADLGTEDYIWLMRELSDWSNSQAESASFRIESFAEMETD